MSYFYMLSAELEKNSEEVNSKLSAELGNKLNRYKAVLHNRKVTDALGCYFGSSEKSFRFEGSKADLSLIRALAFADYQQDSILEVETNSDAYLHYHDGRRQYVGKWTETDRQTALAHDCYTIIEGRYFITVK